MPDSVPALAGCLKAANRLALADGRLLYINPSRRTSPEPLVDGVTRMMTAAFRAAEETGVVWRGRHTRACGARSGNTDWYLPGEVLVNSLCVHYLAFHRDEVPAAGLAFAAALTAGKAEPDAGELAAPSRRLPVHGRLPWIGDLESLLTGRTACRVGTTRPGR